MGMFDGSCRYCSKSLSDYSSIKYSRMPPSFSGQSKPWNYCSKDCYDKGKSDFDKQFGSSSASGGNSFAAGLWDVFATWVLTKVIPFVAPYIGWIGAIALPFLFYYDFDLSMVPLWAMIFSFILGMGIAVAIKLVPFPKKIQRFRKFFLWLPIIIVIAMIVILIAIIVIKKFVLK